MTYIAGLDACSAYEALDKKSFQGRLLHILPAQDRPNPYRIEEGGGRKKTVKGEKEAKRKDMAGKAFNWSMLYMNVSLGAYPLLRMHCSSSYRVMLWRHQ